MSEHDDYLRDIKIILARVHRQHYWQEYSSGRGRIWYCRHEDCTLEVDEENTTAWQRRVIMSKHVAVLQIAALAETVE